MRLIFALIFCSFGCSVAHADGISSGPAVTLSIATGTTTTSNTTSEQSLITYTITKPTKIPGLYMDLTALATTVTAGFKVYYTPSGGSERQLGLPSLLTGLLTWTLATDVDGLSVPMPGHIFSAGDSLRVTVTLSLGEVRAIPYRISLEQ